MITQWRIVLSACFWLVFSATAMAGFNPELRLSTIKGPSIFPRLAAFNGVLHATWVEYVNAGADPEIFYTRSPDNGLTWNTPVNLSNNPGRPDTLPIIAADSGGVYILWTSDPISGEIFFRRSLDGGLNWQGEAQLSNSANGYSRGSDVFIDRSGNLHIVYFDSRNVGYGQVYHRMSCDKGASWTAEQNVTQNDGVVDNEQPRITQLPGGALYLVFRSSRAGRPQGGWEPFSLFGVRSRSASCPGGATWFYPAQALSPLYPEDFIQVYSPSLLTTALGPRLAYWDRTSGVDVSFRQGNPDGSGWGPIARVTQFPANHPEADGNVEGIAPSLAEAPGAGLYAAFQQTTGAIEGFSTGPALYSSSADGVSWTSPAPITSRTDVMHPRMIYQNGKLHFLWADFRHINQASFGAEIYYRSFSFESQAASDALLTHYYQAILGRAPDSGIAFWQSEVVRMQSLNVDTQEAFRVMAGYFFTSDEYKNKNTSNTQYVTDLYNTFFNRGPDGGGLNYWTGLLTAGLPRGIVMDSFMFSDEFATYMTNALGATISRGEVYAVVDFYRGVLNRLPDTSGFNFWLGQFRTAQCQGTAAVNAQVNSISNQFIFSDEYSRRARNNSQYIEDMYYAFLRRGGELEGFNFWVDQLNSRARTRDQVRLEFINSPEFQERVQQIIAQGCFS